MESSRKVADISGNRNLENISRNEPFKPKLEKKPPPQVNFLIFQEIELPNSNIKKLIVFSQKKAFFIFPEMESCSFQPKLKKKKKKNNLPPKIFLVFDEMELSYIFSRETFSYILENRNTKTDSYISGNIFFLYFKRNFQSLENQNFLYFLQKCCD